MRTWARVIACGAAAVLVSLTACGERGRKEPTGPLPVILITLDTLRPDHLGCYGHSRVRTPNLDRLARGSVRFEEAVTPVPSTLAAHLSILTGTCPRTHGVPRNGFRASDDNLTLAEILKERGYETAAFVSAFSLDERFHAGQGFDRYDCEYDAAITPESADQAQRRAERTTDAVLKWLSEEDRGDAPFFLWVHYFDPHFPYDPPPPYDRLYDKEYSGRANGSMRFLEDLWEKRVRLSPDDRAHVVSLYDGEISYMDEHLGRLFQAFEASGLLERAVLVITADHGESLGEQGYEFDHGMNVHDPSIRVPLLLRAPGFPRGKVVREQVEIVDILPTVLEVLRLPVPARAEGRSLLPLVGGDGTHAERTAFSEASKPYNAEPDSGGLFRNAWKAKCARTHEWKYVSTPYERQRALYHLTEDPGETRNVLTRFPDVARAMERELEAWATRPREPLPAEDLSPDPETLEKLRALGYVQ